MDRFRIGSIVSRRGGIESGVYQGHRLVQFQQDESGLLPERQRFAIVVFERGVASLIPMDEFNAEYQPSFVGF